MTAPPLTRQSVTEVGNSVDTTFATNVAVLGAPPRPAVSGDTFNAILGACPNREAVIIDRNIGVNRRDIMTNIYYTFSTSAIGFWRQ